MKVTEPGCGLLAVVHVMVVVKLYVFTAGYADTQVCSQTGDPWPKGDVRKTTGHTTTETIGQP